MKRFYFACIILILGCSQPQDQDAPKADSSAKLPGDALNAMVGPYKDSGMNAIYNLLFCDNIELYKEHNNNKPAGYPFDVLFSETSSIDALQKIVDDDHCDPRVKILAYNKMRALGHGPDKKQLLAVIVEVGLENGTDVLASFYDGTARYINETGKLLVWETTDKTSNELTQDLFLKGNTIINKIGVWDGPRQAPPLTGNARITCLASDGLYYKEAPIGVLFSDSLVAPALTSATQLMKYLTETALNSK